MPTIDQLAPATAASDTDEILVSQSGTTRKVTRAQVLSGVQPALAIPSRTILGRISAGVGSPETITIGSNLSLNGSTLVAAAAPFSVSLLPSGTVPAPSDNVPLSQSGTNTSITYAQFLSGLPGVPNLNASQALVFPTGAGTSVKLADLAASMLPAAGGSMTGPLLLSGTPSVSAQAATKGYVDTQSAAALPRAGGALTGPLTLSGDPATALQAVTKQYADTRVFRNGDTLTGALVLASDPVSSLQAATKQYVDTQVGAALPKTGGSLTGSLLLNADPTATNQAATKHYVDAQLGTALPLSGGSLTGSLTLNGAPTAAAQAATKQYVDGQVSTALPLSGGTLTGALTLAGSPTTPLGAATKQYVDTTAVGTGVINVKAAPYNAQLNGVADDTAAFKAAYVAAPAGSVIYVPFGVTVLQNPNNWGISLTKRVKWIVDGTTLVDGTPLASAIPSGTNPVAITLPGVVVGNTAEGAEVSLSGSQPTDFAVLHSSYIVNHTGGTSGSVIANARTDTIIYNSPNDYVWGGLDRLVWTGIQTPTASAPAQHVGRYIQTVRQTIGTNSSGAALPQPQLWAACLEMRDATGQPSSSSNATLTVEMDMIANGLDDGNNRQIQSLVVEQNDRSGAPVEVSTIIGVYLGAGSTGHAKTVFGVGIPFNRSVLDTTNAIQLAGGAAIRLAAGHTIAFEATGSNYLAYDSTTGTLRWNQGSLSYVVGKGITVGWQYVAAGNATLPNYIAGDLVFLAGSGTYTITLPAASSVPAGVGFTFSSVGTAAVTISPIGSDVIDNGPIVLRPSDRYHIVSDGSGSWREIFRTNSVSPRFTGPPVFPSYTVAALPTIPGTGAKAFVTNGRKPADAAGAGTGVEVFYDGSHWISVCSGTQVSA